MNCSQRSCPGCESVSSGEIEVRAKQSPVDLTMDEITPYWNGFYKEKLFFPYERCSHCGLLYSPVYFTESQLNDLYRQMPPNMELVPRDSLERTQNGYYELIRNEINDAGAYLEIGADIGLFTINCMKSNRFREYWLVEPNVAVHHQLIKLNPDSKCAILKDMQSLSIVPNETVSFVSMIHVLDHLTDPVSSLNEIRKKMTSGSRLLIVTHDESSLLRQILNTRWPAFCLQHPQLYNKATMAAMLEKTGYKVIKQLGTKNEFPISFLIKQILWAMGIKVERVPDFFGWTVCLPLGNILALAEPMSALSDQ